MTSAARKKYSTRVLDKPWSFADCRGEALWGHRYPSCRFAHAELKSLDACRDPRKHRIRNSRYSLSFFAASTL
jgi:hypothetical protein